MKNVFLNVRTAKAQAGCAKLKDTSLSFRRGLGRGFLFTFLLLTLGVGQMWADNAGFWSDGAAQVTFTVNGRTVSVGMNSSSFSEYDLGTVESLTLSSAWAKTWKNNSGNVCGVDMYYKVATTKPNTSSMTKVELRTFSDLGSGNQQISKSGINANLSSSKTAGTTYYITINFDLYGNKGGSSGCYTGNGTLNNGGSHYIFKFKMADSNTKFTQGKYIYLDARNQTNWKSADFTARFYFKRYDTSADIANVTCANTNKLDSWVYYAVVPAGDYNGKLQVDRVNPNNISQQWCTTSVVAASGRSSGNNCLGGSSSSCSWSSPSWTTYAPPLSAVSLSDNGTAILAGGGTELNPYLIATGSTIKVRASGTKAVADPDATIWYDIKDNTTSKQNSSTAEYSFTASSTAGTTHQMKVDGYTKVSSTPSTKLTSSIVYYQTVSVKDISVYIYVGGHSEGDINSVEMNGCTPYVGTKALAAVKINNQSAGAPKFTLSGNWLVYTFTNVTKVSNITCARSGGNIFTGEITDNVYYTYEGAALPGQCVPRANPTWGTAPASGAIGGSMTATVSGAPAGATITWSSTNTSAATVSGSGVISYRAAGNTTIKANVSWGASGDYCASSYELSQVISVTSGATVTATRTCPAYVSTGAGEVTLDITSTGASSGWYYRIKNKSTGGYYAPDNQSAASNALSWTMTGGIGAELTTLVVELYNGSNTLICTSSDVTVTGEVAHITYIAAGSNGSVSPKTIYANNNHVHPSITATPNSHYHFKEWTSNNAAASVASTKNATTTVTATAGGYTITAYFEGDQYTITYKDKDNAAYSGSNRASLPATHRYGTATALVNGVRSGYTFVGWYTNSSCTGDAVTSIGATSQTGNFTLYAKWTENTVTLTPTNHYDAGNPGYSAPTGGGTIGISTTRTIVAPAAGTGYTFAGWTLSSNLVVTGGNKNTDRTITVRTNGDGNAVSATANYNEVLTTDWYLTGSMNSWSTTANKFAKHTGESTGSVAYTTIDLAANTHYEFGVNNGSDYYANNNGSSEDYYIKGTIENWTFNKDLGYGVNCHIKTTLAGTYTFKIDFSAANPKISVYYPEIYAISGDFNSWTETSNLVFDGNVGTATINITGSATAYEFKVLENGVWCGATLNITGDVSNQQLTVGGGDNITLSADVYPNGDYTFTYNKSTHKLAVTYPTSYQISFDRVPTEGGKTAPWGNFTGVLADKQITSGVTKIADGATAHFYAANQSDGYTYYGWYTVNDAPKGTYTNRLVATQEYSTTVTSSTPSNLYATYYPKQCTVSFDYQLSTEGHGNAGTLSSVTATYDAAMPALTGNMPTAAEGYAFMGFFSETGGNGTKYYNPDKTSAHNWDIDTESATTLYAYYKKAEITSITFSPAAVEPGDEVTATAVISPNPTGSTMVCWEVRYASNNVLLDPQPTFDPENGASVTFTAPSAAVYKFTATLKTGSDCAAGTVLDTEDANLTVAGSHPVTIRYKHGDVVIKEETIQNIHATVATGISAPNIIGYSFSSWTLGDGITKVSGNLTDPSITVTAIYDGVITANYTPKRMIYFYNTLGWSSVNVYFYKNDTYWNNTNGTGANTGYTFTNTPYSEGKHGAMTNITGTNIWYFDAEGAGVNASYDDVVFTELDQHGYGYFAKTDDKQNKVVRRGDYKSSMPMFVPVEQDGVSLNGGLAIYYNEGYWMNYPENTGYTVRIYNAWNVDMTSPAREYYFPYSSDKKMPLKLDVEFNTTDAKWFSIYRNDGVYLGVNALMTQASHTNYRIKDSNNKIKIQPSAPGIYTYTLTFYDDGEKDGSGKAYGNMYHITVDYPVSVGDFRILYSDNAEWSQGWAHNSVGHAWCHPSDAINKISAEATEAKKDTVSLFVSYGASPTAKFQYVSAINPSTGAVTWSDVDGGTISLSSITKSGTYNFIISQPVGGASVSVEKIEAYTGNYYIRTDCAGNTKWDSYRAADHQMTYSEFSCSEANSFGEKFSHYFTHWCPAGMNVKFVIANDYSSCISDTLIQDVGNIYNNINSDGFLNSDGNPEETENRFSANIRFMYNEATNKISRAYVASSTNASRLFLVLRGNEVIKDENGTAVNDQGVTNGAILSDKENWIYEKTLKILPGSKFKLFACYAEVTPSQSGAQYFRGYWAEDDWVNSANTIELVGGSGSYQKVRVLYDFKTNRLVCAWLPDGDVTGEMNINADVMIIREHQEDATMITFTNSSSKLGGVKTVYGAMKFNRWILNNKSTAAGHAVLDPSDQKSIYERALYFISFPFDVNLGEVFGFGTYGVHWIIENYDGENRAKNGYWIDSPPNWKYVTSPKGYTLKANKGYILCLDLDLMKDDNEEFWPHGIETVELFFPSAVMQSTIEQAEVTIPAPDPAIYQCTINRGTPEGDRTIKDSYWRCLGVPSFANYTTTLSNGTSTITWQTGSTLPYLYAWNMENNTLTAQGTSTFAFKTMHAYLTQCSTAIVWTAASKPTPAAIARYSENDMLKDREFRLELVENGVKADQTYIRLSAKEDVTSGFEFGNDLSKELNSGVSNIYTFIGYERAAANSLPLSTEQITIVPVGVVANAAGEYTFSMPDGTDGIGVTLIDEETGIRTSLSALDYTVELDKGTYDSRFWLEISPVKGAETGIDPGVDARENGVRKVMIDGILYIVKDGKLFDARGARVE